MAIHFTHEKWIEIQNCWVRIENIINTESKISKKTVINSNNNEISINNTNDNNTLKKDIILMNNLLLKNINNNEKETKDISLITSNEFNNIMNEIDNDVKINDINDKNKINDITSINEEYNKLIKIQKDFISKPVMLIFFTFVISFICGYF